MSLRSVVAVKYVPDATGDRHFADDLTTDRDAVDGLLSDLDEYAVEQALQISDAADDAEITVLTVGRCREADSPYSTRRVPMCRSTLSFSSRSRNPWSTRSRTRREVVDFGSPARRAISDTRSTACSASKTPSTAATRATPESGMFRSAGHIDEA